FHPQNEKFLQPEFGRRLLFSPESSYCASLYPNYEYNEEMLLAFLSLPAVIALKLVLQLNEKPKKVSKYFKFLDFLYCDYFVKIVKF
ncbi:hypothetical protein, partial [Paenibacillus sonchi]|uniref:hypothetical protein n=1 Tax=Paenibacillus sonchi TaxID=373687 RepID=UPI001ADFF501